MLNPQSNSRRVHKACPEPTLPDIPVISNQAQTRAVRSSHRRSGSVVGELAQLHSHSEQQAPAFTHPTLAQSALYVDSRAWRDCASSCRGAKRHHPVPTPSALPIASYLVLHRQPCIGLCHLAVCCTGGSGRTRLNVDRQPCIGLYHLAVPSAKCQEGCTSSCTGNVVPSGTTSQCPAHSVRETMDWRSCIDLCYLAVRCTGVSGTSYLVLHRQPCIGLSHLAVCCTNVSGRAHHVLEGATLHGPRPPRSALCTVPGGPHLLLHRQHCTLLYHLASPGPPGAAVHPLA